MGQGNAKAVITGAAAPPHAPNVNQRQNTPRRQGRRFDSGAIERILDNNTEEINKLADDLNTQLLRLISYMRTSEEFPKLCSDFFLKVGDSDTYIFLGVLAGCSDTVKGIIRALITKRVQSPSAPAGAESETAVSQETEVLKCGEGEGEIHVLKQKFFLSLLSELKQTGFVKTVEDSQLNDNEKGKPSDLFDILCYGPAASAFISTPNENRGSPSAIYEMLLLYYRQNVLGLTNKLLYGPLMAGGVVWKGDTFASEKNKLRIQTLINIRLGGEEGGGNEKNGYLSLCFKLMKGSVESIKALLKALDMKEAATAAVNVAAPKKKGGVYYSEFIQKHKLVAIPFLSPTCDDDEDANLMAERGLVCAEPGLNATQQSDGGPKSPSNEQADEEESEIFICHGKRFKFIIRLNTWEEGGAKNAVMQIIFKGTTSGAETLTDLHFSKKKVAIDNQKKGIGMAYEHAGFHNLIETELMYLTPFLGGITRNFIMRGKKAVNNVTVVVSGHSLGGALTQLLALRIKTLMNDTLEKHKEFNVKENLKFLILAMGSPRCFNAVLALILIYDIMKSDDMMLILLENPHDIITSVPVQAQGTAKPIGSEINWSRKYGMLRDKLQSRLKNLARVEGGGGEGEKLLEWFENGVDKNEAGGWQNFDPRLEWDGDGKCEFPRKKGIIEKAKIKASHVSLVGGMVLHGSYPPYISGRGVTGFSSFLFAAGTAWKPGMGVGEQRIVVSWPHNNLEYAVNVVTKKPTASESRLRAYFIDEKSVASKEGEGEAAEEKMRVFISGQIAPRAEPKVGGKKNRTIKKKGVGSKNKGRRKNFTRKKKKNGSKTRRIKNRSGKLTRRSKNNI